MRIMLYTKTILVGCGTEEIPYRYLCDSHTSEENTRKSLELLFWLVWLYHLLLSRNPLFDVPYSVL